jgi:hypothetical protein
MERATRMHLRLLTVVLICWSSVAAAQWQSLGKIDNAGWAFEPTASFDDSSGWVDVFAVSASGRMFTNARHQSSNAWTGWSEVPGGGIFNSAPSATTWNGATLDLCGRGTDNYVWCTSCTNGFCTGGWHRFDTGNVTSAPAVIRKGPNELHIFATTFANGAGRLSQFVTDGNNILRTIHRTRAPREDIAFGSAPSVDLQSIYNIEVVIHDLTGRVFRSSWWDNWNGWTVWEKLEGSSVGSPAITVLGGEHMWVVVTDKNRQMRFRKHVGDNVWTAWTLESGGGVFVSGPALVSRNTNVVDAFGVGTDNALYWRTLN